MFQKIDYTMVTVSNMDTSIAFYRDVLGLPLKFATPDWTEFETGPTVLALHGGGVPGLPAPPEPGKTFAGSCSIGFTVADVNDVYRRLQEQGARFVMPPTRQDAEGIWLAVCIDPDGLPIAFAQSLR